MIDLYTHQKDVIKFCKMFVNCGQFLDMGLGKTITGTEMARLYDSYINLVICQKSKVKDWYDHILKNGYGFVIDFTKNSHLTAEDITAYSGHTQVWVVVNYELAWRREELKRLSDFTLILDESSLIQNSSAKQTRFVMKLRPSHVILLSGTPCSGKYENLWTQASLLGWKITKTEFNERYVNWELIKVGNMYHKIVSRKNPYKNVEELKEKLREHGCIFMKTEDCFDLPDQTFVDVKVPVTREYRNFKKNRTAIVDGNEIIGDSNFAYRMYLRQFASQWSQEKLDAFKDILDSTNDRLIVFYNFNEELKVLLDACRKRNKPVSFVNGKSKDLRAYDEEEDSVTLIQYQAGSMGLNLQKANKILFYSLPERSDLFEQSKKRIHRIGQKNPCTYYIMKTEGSIEENIHRALLMKKDYTDELFREEFG